jgi:hypothetical protein
MTIDRQAQPSHQFPVTEPAPAGINQTPSASALPRRQETPSSGYAFVGTGEVPAAQVQRPPQQSSSGKMPAVPASTLAHGGADHVDKLAALVNDPNWTKLPPKLQSAILKERPDRNAAISARLSLFREFHDREQECLTPQAFGKWLQGQHQPLKQFYRDFYQPVLRAPLIDLHPLSPNQRIDALLAAYRPVTAELVLDALKGRRPELGTLPLSAQQ